VLVPQARVFPGPTPAAPPPPDPPVSGVNERFRGGAPAGAPLSASAVTAAARPPAPPVGPDPALPSLGIAPPLPDVAPSKPPGPPLPPAAAKFEATDAGVCPLMNICVALFPGLGSTLMSPCERILRGTLEEVPTITRRRVVPVTPAMLTAVNS
jgi:hypothetical protein